MDFSEGEDRQLFRDTISRFLREGYRIEVRHAGTAAHPGYAPEVWAKLADLGAIGAMFGEDQGGFAGEGADIATLFSALGTALVVEPFLPCLMAGTVLAGAGRSLDAVIAGDEIVALAHGEPGSRYDLAHVTTTAKKSGDGWVLDGLKSGVLCGDAAGRLVVSARISGGPWDEAGIALFEVRPGAAGLSVRGHVQIDGTRAAELRLEGVSETGLLVGPETGYAALEVAHAKGALALSAEALGVMEVCRDMTLEYLKTRKQFGRAIGTFQALQHRMATVLTEIEQVRSSVMNAAAAADGPRVARERAASAAKAMAGRIGRLVAEEAIQMHGGVGMTWEYALGHYAKRLVMIDHVLGDVDHHTARYVALGRAA